MENTMIGTAQRGASAASSPASATISGDGVSPAASAAASGSPPGSPAETSSAERGRRPGSVSKQRINVCSTSGSSPSTIDDGWLGGPERWSARSS